MPGRPRSMAKKVWSLEERALEVAVDLFCDMPGTYISHRDPRDPANRLWNNASDAAMWAMIEIARLGDRLRARAGIDVPGPAAQCFSDTEEPGQSDRPPEPEPGTPDNAGQPEPQNSPAGDISTGGNK